MEDAGRDALEELAQGDRVEREFVVHSDLFQQVLVEVVHRVEHVVGAITSRTNKIPSSHAIPLIVDQTLRRR
jgi:hypothetical protein